MDLAERAQAIADKARGDREAQARANRERYAWFIPRVDEYQARFGAENCRVTYLTDQHGEANG
jgi:hypothetical protein